MTIGYKLLEGDHSLTSTYGVSSASSDYRRSHDRRQEGRCEVTPIPSDAHLCVYCKLRERYNGTRAKLCATCILVSLERLLSEDRQPVREFRDLGKGG
jgi:hypothetical protein